MRDLPVLQPEKFLDRIDNARPARVDCEDGGRPGRIGAGTRSPKEPAEKAGQRRGNLPRNVTRQGDTEAVVGDDSGHVRERIANSFLSHCKQFKSSSPKQGPATRNDSRNGARGNAPLVVLISSALSDAPGHTRALGLIDCVLLVVGAIIGFGIFLTPSGIARLTGSVSGIPLLWVVGGVLTFCGALAYAEPGSAYPRAGGI